VAKVLVSSTSHEMLTLRWLRVGKSQWGWKFLPVGPDRSAPLSVGRYMDTQTKREILLLAIGTALVELPAAVIAFVVLTH
jgi:hypothetical protein